MRAVKIGVSTLCVTFLFASSSAATTKDGIGGRQTHPAAIAARKDEREGTRY